MIQAFALLAAVRNRVGIGCGFATTSLCVEICVYQHHYTDKIEAKNEPVFLYYVVSTAITAIVTTAAVAGTNRFDEGYNHPRHITLIS